MNLRAWELFKHKPEGEEDGVSGGGDQGESTIDTDFQDTAADDDLAREGQDAIDAEGDSLDSEAEDEEQPEGQDDAEEEGEEAPAPLAARAFKDTSGNWDWQKITKAIGSPDLERTFKETQAQITKVSQENKDLRGQVEHVPQLQQRAQMMDYFDRAYHENPEFRAAVTKALGVGTGGRGEQNFELPEGVNPGDPLVPLIMRQQRMLDQFAYQQQMSQQERQQHEQRATFLQGLKEARSFFESNVGRQPTEDELRTVAKRMQQTGNFTGADHVPTLFLKEIREKIQADLSASRASKRNLPIRGKGGAKTAGTQKATDLHAAFEDSWKENMG